MQSYGMLFHKKNCENSIEIIVREIYRIIKELILYGDELYPRYRTTKTKNKTLPFEAEEDTIRDIVVREMKKNEKYPGVGGIFGLYSSLDEDYSSGVRFSFGNIGEYVRDTVVVNFPLEHFSGLFARRNDLYVLFQNIVKIYKPYYAIVFNAQNDQISDKYWITKPTCVHWINFFSNETVNLIGREKLKHLDQQMVLKTNDGCFLRLQDEPIDITNLAHLHKQRELSKMLGLLSS